MTDQESTAEALRALKDLVQSSGEKIRAYRKIFLVWGAVILFDAVLSQILVNIDMAGSIPLVWIPTLALGILLSRTVAKTIREETKINPLLLRYLAALWFGGIAVVVAFFAITTVVPMFSLMYLPALSFPIMGLCAFGSAVLFKSRLGYVLSILFFVALLPAALFPHHALLLQAILMGGGLLVLGISKNA
jgi:hypothetical protein